MSGTGIGDSPWTVVRKREFWTVIDGFNRELVGCEYKETALLIAAALNSEDQGKPLSVVYL